MTALCGGGASEPQPGVSARVAYFGTVLAGLIEEIFGPVAIPIAAAVGVLSYQTTTFCAEDPPTLPTLDATDVTNLLAVLGGSPPDTTTIAKLDQLIGYYAWFKLCQCSSTTTPAPTGSTWPTGVGTNTNVTNPIAQACAHNNQPSSIFGTTPKIDTVFGPTFVTLPSGATTFQLQLFDVGIDQNVIVNTVFFNETGGQLANINNGVLLVGQPGIVATNAVPVGTVKINVQLSWSGTMSSAARYTWIADAFCGQNPFQILQNCCPPDTYSQALLQKIANMVELIQRQQVPFGYVHGPTHSGLTATGELPIADLIGVQVAPASIPNYAGVVVGDPDSLWLDSWIRWGNADGWTQREFLTSAPFVSLPNFGGQYTKIGYTLAPGLTVDITELVREP